MTSESELPKQRINMTHGFMKSVIQNQIDRDNYDKEVKAQQEHGRKQRPRVGPNKPKKPELQAYVPPQRSKTEQGESKDHLFVLEYEHKNGDIHKTTVTKNDNPDSVARKVGSKFGLTEPFVKALAKRIQEEMDKRLV